MSRPSELTPEIADRIAQLIRAGNWPATAAVAAGISERSYYRWMARGEKAEERNQNGRRVLVSERPFWQFWQQVKRAERECEAIAVSYLMKAMPHTPTAVTTFLERRFPQRWTRTERTELTGSDGGPMQVEDPTEAIIAEAERISKRLLGIAEGDDTSQVVGGGAIELRSPLLSNGTSARS